MNERLKQSSKLYEKEKEKNIELFEACNRKEELERSLKQVKEQADTQRRSYIELQHRLANTLEENSKLEEALRRSQEIIEEQVLAIDDTNPTEDPNIMLGIKQENEKQNSLISQLQDKVHRLKEQLDMSKKDLEVERQKKVHDHSDFDHYDHTGRKLSYETEEMLRKMQENREECLSRSEGRMSNGSGRSIEVSPVWKDLQIAILPSLSAGKFDKSSSPEKKKCFADKDTQYEVENFSPSTPQIIIKEVIKESPEKIIIKEQPVTYIVSFKPVPFFDFREIREETMYYQDPSSFRKLQTLATTTYNFGGASKSISNESKSHDSPVRNPEEANILHSSSNKIESIVAIQPLMATQKLEKGIKKYFIGTPRSSKPSKPSKKMNFNIINQQLFPVEDNPFIEHGIPNNYSFHEVNKELNKTSFLCLDMDQGTLKESLHMPYANDSTSINIRKILKSTQSNRVSRQKLEPRKDSYWGDGDDASSRYNVTKEDHSISNYHRLDTEDGQEDHSTSKISQHSFIDLGGAGGHKDPDSPYNKQVMTARNKKSLLMDDQRVQYGSSSAMAMRESVPDNFKEKKRMLNHFFEMKNLEKDKPKKQVYESLT